MKIIRNRSCLIIYLLFIAIFKPYFLPTRLQQVIKLVTIFLCLLLIVTKMKPRKWINISLLYSGIVTFSSYLAYKNNYLSNSTFLDSIFYSVCIYVVYSILELLCTKGYSKDVMKCVLDISGTYAILTFFSLFLPLYVDDSGLEVYLFGNKFLSFYYLLFFMMLFYSIYYKKIKELLIWRILFYVIMLMSLFFAVISKCSTGALAIIVAFILLLFDDKIKKVIVSPIVLLGSMGLSALFPTFMTFIMKNKMINYIVVQVFHESSNLNFRSVIYTNHVFQLIDNSFWFGYGYNNTMMLNRTNQVFSNAQNALLEIMIKYGIIGTIIFLIIVYYCFKIGSKSESIQGLVYLIYLFVLIGTIEVSYSWLFLFAIFMIRWISYDDEEKTHNIKS